MIRILTAIAIFSIGFSQGILSADEPIQKILFGSCIRQGFPIPILKTMAEEKADAIIFLGDNIYADTEDMQVMQQKYAALGSNPDFQELVQGIPTFAVWDDHDFGQNDAGAAYPKRDASQKEFLKFWKVPESSPRYKRSGTYDSVILGSDGKRVQLLLLDTRYFRSPLKKGEQRRVGGPYIPDEDSAKTMLGETQWTWLKSELKKPAEIRIVASSIQLLASDAGQETWSNFPRERERFLKLIQETKTEGLFIISGDRHWSEFSKSEEFVDYPIYDFTSSSFNQIHLRGTPTENQFRDSQTTYHLQNYGVIEFDWTREDHAVRIQIKDLYGQPRMENRFSLSTLKFDR